MKIFEKPKTLTATLRELRIGEMLEVPYRVHRPSYVRQQVSTLRKEGLNYVATEIGLIDSIKVIRIK